MHTEAFDFPLPPELVAQAPAATRDGSRLLHLRKPSGTLTHRAFAELPALLRAGDLLVFNDARVIPARLLGKKAGTGGKVELLLVRPLGAVSTPDALGAAAGVAWSCLGQASKGLKPGARVEFDAGLVAVIEAARGGGEYEVRFEGAASLGEAIARAGRLPLPPYIERPPTDADAERYQTIFARAEGSVAAPTAGLHFTPEVFAALDAKGVQRAFVTLDVGPGTFLPVRDGDVAAHVMHPERYTVPAATRAAVAAAKREGRRVVAVGTTVVRTLESAAGEGGVPTEGPGETRIFITPGYTFRVVDALLTNFHLPKSTLVMLVSAFAGREQVLAAYAEAVRERYRFFSYGDAMFIEGDA